MEKLIRTTINLVHRSILLVFDSGTMLLCFWIGYHLWVVSPYRLKPVLVEFNWTYALIYIIIIDCMLIWGGTYKLNNSVMRVVQVKEVIKYFIIGFIIIIFISFFTKILLISRLQVIMTFIIALPSIVIERIIIDKLWTFFFVKKFAMKRVIIYGAGETGKRIAKSINNHPKLGYRAIGFFDDYKEDNAVVMANPLAVMGGKQEFVQFLRWQREKLDEVLIAMPAASTEQIMHIMGLCQEYGVPYKFVPSLNDLMLHRVRQEQLDGIPLYSAEEPFIPLTNRFTKRIFDVVGSIVILTVVSPLIAFFAAWIRKDTLGPVIFRQKRIGFKGNEFIMYKFRTMFIDTPPYHWHPNDRSDPRITRAGRFLRKTSLDELPQFWNVLRGEMSIVGPRPEMPFIVDTYNQYQRDRLNAKPGITGLWQISGDRSLPIHENIDHDLYYINHQSLLLDIVIVMQTVWFALIRGVGAK
jgi:exopolysaccharide biosynthesis polyprenyl glycosylphosphotransferase